MLLVLDVRLSVLGTETMTEVLDDFVRSCRSVLSKCLKIAYFNFLP